MVVISLSWLFLLVLFILSEVGYADCHLPYGMSEHLATWQNESGPSAFSSLASCLQSIQNALQDVCLSLEKIPAVEIVSGKIASMSQSALPWRDAIALWAAEQRDLLEGVARSKECSSQKPRLLISVEFLEGLAGQFAALALDAVSLWSSNDFNRRAIVRWLIRFESLWVCAAHYAVYLQYLTLSAFDALSDLSYRFHRGEWRRRYIDTDDGSQRKFTTEGEIFDLIVRATPSFMLEGFGWEGLAFQGHVNRSDANSPSSNSRSVSSYAQIRKEVSWRERRGAPLLKHDSLASDAVLAVARKLSKRYQKLLLVEVGVFRGNLSGKVWDSMVYGPGSLELHLVDHWGNSDRPMWRPPWFQYERKDRSVWSARQDPLGTGSDMGGQSNETTMLSVWRRFSYRSAACTEVFDGRPDSLDTPLRSRSNVFFHRTTTVSAARRFKDNSVDLVYIDADHKWWSVLQDLCIWWPKVRPGGVLMGHDFHLNSLMEREDDPGGDSNDVPMTVAAFFRAPLVVTLHAGFVWSVTKPSDVTDSSGSLGSATSVVADEVCGYLRERLAPHYNFEICADFLDQKRVP